jgi:hypothetical protein
MPDEQIGAFPDIASIPSTEKDKNPPGFDRVTHFLQRFGYLPPDEYTDRGLDRTASQALEAFQEFYSLPVTGQFDDLTRDAMTLPRCGLPDVPRTAAFATACRWTRPDLAFVLDTGTADVAGQAEWDAVRAAFNTWQALGIVTFREVRLNQNPDIFFDWRPADDLDLNMAGGILAHADFPPGCSVVTNDLPKPIHFDDSEHTWAIGAVSDAFDIETVALHEIGHIIGLAHSSVAGAVMQPFVTPNSTLRTLTQDDINGFNALYAKVPNVVGDMRVDATKLVRAAHLMSRFIPAGGHGGLEVTSQSPAGGTVVAPSSVVTMYLEFDKRP